MKFTTGNQLLCLPIKQITGGTEFLKDMGHNVKKVAEEALQYGPKEKPCQCRTWNGRDVLQSVFGERPDIEKYNNCHC